VRRLLIGGSPDQGRYPASKVNDGACPEKPVHLRLGDSAAVDTPVAQSFLSGKGTAHIAQGRLERTHFWSRAMVGSGLSS
jgi:hypothetical protein